MSVVKLENLLIEELSGVDDPANMLPGWMVRKGRAGAADYSAQLKTEPGLSSVLFNVDLVARMENVPAKVVKAAKDQAIATAVRASYSGAGSSSTPAPVSSPTARLYKSLFRHRA